MSISRPPEEAEVRQGLAAGNRQRGGCEPNLLTQDVCLRRAQDTKNTCTMGGVSRRETGESIQYMQMKSKGGTVSLCRWSSSCSDRHDGGNRGGKQKMPYGCVISALLPPSVSVSNILSLWGGPSSFHLVRVCYSPCACLPSLQSPSSSYLLHFFVVYMGIIKLISLNLKKEKYSD